MISYDIQTAARHLDLVVYDTFWGNCQVALVNHLLTTDVTQFLTWPEVLNTMFVGEANTARVEYDALQADDWDYWSDLIRENGFGGAPKLSYDTHTSGNLVHQAYHLMRWQTTTGRRVSELNTIVEIGAGYGALAMLVRRAGFRGRYVIIDLPAFALLQRFYLAQANVEAEWGAPGDKIDADLVIGLWSLSEMTQTDQINALGGLDAGGYLVAACGELNIPKIDQAARYEAIEHMPPNGYWLA
jgi:hypothetical protein